MKKVIVFITHKTLGLDHAEMTFMSLANQKNLESKFDALYILNSHPEELSNDSLLKLFFAHNLETIFRNVEIIPNIGTVKLYEDISYVRNYLRDKLEPFDRVLLLKSDINLSKYYLSIIDKLEGDLVYFVSPFLCAKDNVTNSEIIAYLNREQYVRSDDITFFVEDKIHSKDNDFHNRPNIDIHSKQIRFTSCEVVGDFSCHYMSLVLMDYLILDDLTWGGVKFYNIQQKLHPESHSGKCFTIHKYHGIISDNRSTDREGPVAGWLKG